MTIEVCRIDLLGLPIKDGVAIEPGTTRTLYLQTLIRPHVELFVHSNPTGDKNHDQITIKKLMGGEIFDSVTLTGEKINQARESQSRIDGYRIRSV